MNGNRRTLKEDKKKKEKLFLQSADLSYRNIFFSVIMYCTIQYNNAYTLKNKLLFVSKL